MLAAYNPADGKLIWSSPVTTQETVGTAVTDGKYIFASGGWPKNETVCVLADGSGELVWRNSIRTYAPSMLVTEGYVYTMTDKGIAYCWNADTGKMMWRKKFGGDFSASLILVVDHLYASSEQGKTIIFKATHEAFELVAENQLGDEIWATPVICGNHIYLRVAHHRTDGRQEVLYRIGG
jgi:outer membrane protein assembly factor BamB